MLRFNVRSVATGLFFALCAGQSMAGGRVLVDEGNNYIFDGQSWDGDVTTGTGVIPFALDFGSGAISNRGFTIDTRGQVVFSGGDFIAPLLAPTPYAPASQISYSSGLLDPSVLDNTSPTSFDITNGLAAYRFYFNGVCPTGQSDCGGDQFQAVLVALDTEHFVLEFNYGAFSPILESTSASFQLGTNSGSFAGPYSDVGPDYCFSNGVAGAFSTVAACRGDIVVNPNPVPEPEEGALFVLGALALTGSLVARRRRRSPA